MSNAFLKRKKSGKPISKNIIDMRKPSTKVVSTSSASVKPKKSITRPLP